MLFKIVYNVQPSVHNKKKMKKSCKETENSLFACDMVILIENPNNVRDILLELII